MLRTTIRQVILHNIIRTMVVAAVDVMDMDKAEYSTNRTPAVLHRRCRDNSNYSSAVIRRRESTRI